MKPELICFDFDDTLTTQNSWYSLNTALGIYPEEDYKMYTAYINGDIPYDVWINKIEDLYKAQGLATKERIVNVLSRFELRHDATLVISELQKRGYEVIIISGSFDITIAQAAKLLNINLWRAGTTINFDTNDNFTHFTYNNDEGVNKLNQLHDICKQRNILITDCVCVGDGANDIELFKATGQGICFTNGTDEVKSYAKWQIVNLTGLLDILT